MKARLEVAQEGTLSSRPRMHSDTSSARVCTRECSRRIRAQPLSKGSTTEASYRPTEVLVLRLILWAVVVGIHHIVCGDIIGCGATYHILLHYDFAVAAKARKHEGRWLAFARLGCTRQLDTTCGSAIIAVADYGFPLLSLGTDCL